jgi:hypothetical protein
MSLYSAPLASRIKNAFEENVDGTGLRQLVITVAKNHLQNNSFELVINQQCK